MTEAAGHIEVQPSASDMRLVIGASSAGTVFEWYDFFIYGTLGAILSKTFFPTGNATLEMLLFWLVFAVGFGFRPLGAVLFGYLGDKLGRKYTFLVTVTLMGIATAGVGLIPSAASIGYWAPAIVIFLRILQGLALGGEYGGAAIYVAEHAAFNRRGYQTSYIQASVVGGFVLSLIVVLGCKAAMSADTWNAWGWRVPFLLSLVLLAISLWMRFKLSESPVFKAMKEQGELAGNPFVESFTYPGNKKRIFVALFGVAAGLTVIWYTAMFSGLSFLKSALHIEDTAAEIIVGIAAAIGMVFFIWAGILSDRYGRKKPIVIGYVLTLLLLFPTFWFIGSVGKDPTQTSAIAWTLRGPDCSYAPFAPKQETACGKLMADFAGAGVPYTLERSDRLELVADGTRVIAVDDLALDDAKARKAAIEERAGQTVFNFAKHTPSFGQAAAIIGGLLLLMALSGATYGPVAALLTEMFPARVRYSSMSIPYHIGTGYFGGFLPFIASYIVARTGDPYSGLWYTWVVVVIALVVAVWGLPDGKPRDFADDTA
ncbi:sugar transport protein [Novosphingobium kunmingense]|uniref:Sugar transport protein n=1 Tax=Novosphingobium kunmingense TaxID=1211806 RepID=A0A2N0I2N4_9SPHN|nr:MFS transporter [Novosphingobium kunmingense]PKB25459.1 sugar transport protein [Novosphingobium kunmingense]